MVNYIEIESKTALNKLNRKRPYGWDLNIYRGCEHNCRYCFAMYSHDYLGNNNYFEDIYIKKNIVELLEIELSKKSWKREVINIGGVTDSYQPLEERYKLMPEILKLLIKYKTPCIISTKSDLILRDYDLIDKLSKITYVNIAATITTMDEDIREKIEPNGVSAVRRFNMLKEISKTDSSIGLHLMPIIPFLTDKRENLEGIFYNSNISNVDYLLPAVMYLRGRTRVEFFNFIRKDFPELYNSFKILYNNGGADKKYKNQIYAIVNELRDKYNLNSNYNGIMKEKYLRFENKQLSFFD